MTTSTPSSPALKEIFNHARLEHIAGEMRAVYPACLLYTSPSPRDRTRSRMPSSA